MSESRKILAVGVLVVSLSACSDMFEDRLAEVEGLAPTGPAVNTILHAGYIEQAKLEAKEGDYRDANRWADKAENSASGGAVAPEELAAWDLPAGTTGPLTAARARLVKALGAGAADKMPGDAARAQVSFDCWMQEQEENIQPDDIRACRTAFDSAMARLEATPKPRPMAKAPGPFVVYFDFDEAKFDTRADAVLSAVATAASKLEGRWIVVSGHADRAGTDKYNMMLSKERVDAVAAALISRGLAANDLKTGIYGEEKAKIPTKDGVKEPSNRRVEITFTK